MSLITVTKRDGSREPIDISKITKSLVWAAKDYKVSVSEVEIACNLHFYDGIESSEILDITIKTCKDMTTLRTPDYDKMARNLQLQKVYRQAFSGGDKTTLASALDRNYANDHYNHEILFRFSNDEHTELDNCIDHDRDFNFSMAGLEQLIDKYMIKSNKVLVESPQHMFMAIAMDAFHDYKNERMHYVKLLYDALSTFKVSLPTPIMKALRTTSTDYASCVALNIGDTIDSWTEGKSAVVKHTVASAGIGVDLSAISSIADPVKNATISHPGKIPVMRAIDADIQMSSQNGRRGQATVHTNFFDPEIVTIMALNSPRTEASKRINDLKHIIKFSKLFYDRAQSGGDISLFSVRKHPELLSAFHMKDQSEFVRIYEQLEEQGLADGVINARELAQEVFLTARTEVGIYYVMNVDDVNSNSPYLEPITQTNICVEFLTPTKPISSQRPHEPDIGICILANANQGKVSISELPIYTDLLVRMLNNIIHRQTHPTTQANAFIREYASLGIGFSNHAYFLAKNDCKYGSDKGLQLHDEWMENFQFGLLKASNQIAIEQGPAPRFKSTSYSQGIMPYDRCNDEAYKLSGTAPNSCANEPAWASLSESIVEHGLANCALSMIPPSETSSVVGNQTSGIEPIRNLITIKTTKTAYLAQFAPEAIKLADKYDFAFDRPITADFLKHVAVTQAWIDQSISANTFYNPLLYPEGKIPMTELLHDFYLAKHLGVKTLYYQNTYIEDADAQQDACASGGCSV